MLFARKHQRNQVSSSKFLINNKPILFEKSIKYLGILVDQDLTWSLHVGHVRRIGLASLATIRRVSVYMPTRVLIALYKHLFYLTSLIAVWCGTSALRPCQPTCSRCRIMLCELYSRNYLEPVVMFVFLCWAG